VRGETRGREGFIEKKRAVDKLIKGEREWRRKRKRERDSQ
jgi:hypothetical protein